MIVSDKKKIILATILSGFFILLFLVIGLNSSNYKYLLSKRLPKVLAIIITGVSIAISSTIFQTITNNRILTPSVLGLDSLYILIQTLVIFVFGSTSKLIVNRNINFLFTVLIMILFSKILFKTLFNKEKNNILNLLLIGLILRTLFQSLSSFMQMIIDPNEFLHVQDKMFASFNNINTNILLLSTVIITLIVIYIFQYVKELDILLLGRDHAINLGIDYEHFVHKSLLIVSILVSISTALVGPITFLGLLVVNLSRELLNTFKHKYLIITSSLVSILALIGGQLLVERVFNFSTPISVIINFVGGVYFINLLLKESES
ncbi:MAG: iron chelate uptake ABC transporter family permease subunit [Tissierellia bacterium]|nr:iron chelate uptake ABC transporter family permease subunit [Tissierellia bacterium]